MGIIITNDKGHTRVGYQMCVVSEVLGFCRSLVVLCDQPHNMKTKSTTSTKKK